MAADMKPLEPLVGAWSMETSLGSVRATTTFEWVLDGQFLLQRSEIDLDVAPNGVMVIGADPAGDGYLQHYFDSRGVTRVYAMTFENGVWTLLRTKPDFSPFEFHQRYVGRFSDDGTVIEGAWEKSDDGENWELDFGLTYRRAEV